MSENYYHAVFSLTFIDKANIKALNYRQMFVIPNVCTISVSQKVLFSIWLLKIPIYEY